MNKKLIVCMLVFCMLFSSVNVFASEDSSASLKTYMHIVIDAMNEQKHSDVQHYDEYEKVMRVYLKDESGINALSNDYDKVIYILDKDNQQIKSIDQQATKQAILSLENWKYEDRVLMLDELNNNEDIDKIKSDVDALVEKYANDITSNQFTDINNHWAKEYIKYMAGIGVVNGYKDNTFKPDANITRAEFCKLLVSALDIPIVTYDGSFSDISNHWAKDYIQTAYTSGFVKGSYGKFKPDDNITRAEMATMIGRTLDENVSASNQKFSDDLQIPSWSSEYVYKCAGLGLVQGDNNYYRPNDNTTRAEATTILYRLIKE